MGNLCDCLNPTSDADGPGPKTPLLSGNGQPSTSSRDSVPRPTGQSARVFKPDEPKTEFTSSLDVLSKINMATVSTVPALDKTFQDHARLYNELYSQFLELRKCLHDFKAKFEADTAGIPTIAECLRILSSRCGGVRLTGSMSKNCIQITYDKREVSLKCQGPAEEVLEALELYNRINYLTKNILAKAPQVRSSISLVLEGEQKMKREVTKVDPDGRFGPEPLRTASDNFLKLHRLPAFIDTMQKYTGKAFKEIANGSRSLFEET